jgi:hypothetical protein
LDLSNSGEKFGVEYLYSQTGKKWLSLETDDPDKPDQFEDNESDDGLDEGFEEDELYLTVPPLPRSTIPGNKTMYVSYTLKNSQVMFTVLC